MVLTLNNVLAHEICLFYGPKCISMTTSESVLFSKTECGCSPYVVSRFIAHFRIKSTFNECHIGISAQFIFMNIHNPQPTAFVVNFVIPCSWLLQLFLFYSFNILQLFRIYHHQPLVIHISNEMFTLQTVELSPIKSKALKIEFWIQYLYTHNARYERHAHTLCMLCEWLYLLFAARKLSPDWTHSGWMHAIK